jgi:hypothetical protein
MVAILLDKLEVAAEVYATDGDDDTLDLLRANVDVKHTMSVVLLVFCNRSFIFL